MIVLLIIVVGVILISVVYIEHDRAEIQKKQETLEWENHILLTKLKAKELRRHKEMLEKEYDPQI